MGPATEKIRLATFDCYGTLIDWEGGMGPFTRLAARAAGCRAGVPNGEQARVGAAVLSAL